MKSLCLIVGILILSNCVLDIQTQQYNELEMIGFQNCPLKNNCQQIRDSPFFERICECDDKCSSYNDCCINGRRSRNRPPSREVCLQYGNLIYQGAYVIANCPANFTGPAEIRTQCQSGNASDPVLNSPATDTLSRKTYLNRYCALCNNASPANLSSWTIVVSCENSNSGDFSFQDLTYNSAVGSWGINRNGRFDTCEFKFDKPSYINNIRLCRANHVSTCPRTYRRQKYIRYCESYMSVVIGGEIMYRNPHCAVCNGVPVDEITCFSPMLLSRKSNKPFSFALLLDVNRSDGDLVGVSSSGPKCPGRQKYDPFFKKCRPIGCAFPGHRMVDGRCVKR